MGITNLGAVSMSAGGVYNSETVYKKYKVVSANGGSYMYINPTPAAGVPVTDTSHWQQIASVGGQDILDAVTAEKNAAIAAKALAEGYAAQLAAGTASPAGTYANLAALNSGTPTAPNTAKIYITTDDGKWCYYNGSAWVAGGVYQATSDHADVVNIKSVLEDTSELVQSKNYFDRANAESISVYGTPCLMSPYVPVDAGDVFYYAWNNNNTTTVSPGLFHHVRGFDTSKVKTVDSSNWIASYTVPSGTKFIRFVIAQTTVPHIMVSKTTQILVHEDYFSPYYVGIDATARAGVLAINNRLPANAVELVYPAKILGVVGREMNVYYENAILNGRMNAYADCDVNSDFSDAERFRDRLIWKPTTSGNASKTINLHKTLDLVEKSKAVSFVASSASAGTGVINVLVIGDSKVAAGQPTGYLKTIMSGDSLTLNLIGTRYGNINTGDTTNRHEGRGGWSSYTYAFTSGLGGDPNPFYNAGFTDSEYLTHFDFTNYMANLGGTVDIVILALGTNDFGQTIADSMWQTRAMVKSIRAYNSALPIVIGLNEGVYRNKMEWDSRNTFFLNLNKAKIAAFDGREAEKIYVMPLYLNLDLYNDYALTNVPLSSADPVASSSATRKYSADGIHQNNVGFYKFAECIYAAIKYIKS